ncbi:hypothetical protein [Streptomyces olivaceiscleroticus]|uniref:hypothetical protein n=1 Tax=Streptomyces olivaceiscleroticus TaxID=68245 RepID=UPI0031F9BB0C
MPAWVRIFLAVADASRGRESERPPAPPLPALSLPKEIRARWAHALIEADHAALRSRLTEAVTD